MLIILFFANLLIPAIVLGFALMWQKNPPKERNFAYGYRTRRSSLSQKTWDYAQHRLSVMWKKWGTGLLIVSVLAQLPFVIKGNYDALSRLTLLLCAVQIIAVILPIPIIEKQMDELFDEKGEYKNPPKE